MDAAHKQLFDLNLRRLEELEDSRQHAAIAWHEECFEDGLLFRVDWVYRPQDIQNGFILQGRFTEADFWHDVTIGKMTRSTAERGIALLKLHGGRPGKRITWTLDSMHTQRLACDIYPIDGKHDRIAKIAVKYGISHPFPSDDPPHYQVDKVLPYRQLFSPQAQITRLGRAIARSTGKVKAALERTLQRLKNRSGD